MRKRTNRLPNRGQNAVSMDPNNLVILGTLDENKVKSDDRRSKPIVVFRDVGDVNYAVDGRHAAARAISKNEMVDVVFVEGDFKLGKQTVFERVAGMLFRKKEG